MTLVYKETMIVTDFGKSKDHVHFSIKMKGYERHAWF